MSTRTALVRRARAELSAARRVVAAMSRWQLARWLVLPALYLWGTVADILSHPWHTGPVLLTAGALVARYRRPATALLVVALISAVPPVIPALPFLAYGAGRRLDPTRRVAAAFVVAAAAAGVSAVVRFGDSPGVPMTGVVVAGYVAIAILLPAAFGVIRGERRRRVEALRERNATLERAQRLGDLRARMQERARIAGEMHDLLGHRLSLISLYAGALEVRTREQQPEANSQADLIRRTAATALDELRGVLGILRLDTGRLDDEAPAEAVGTRADIEAPAEAVGTRADIEAPAEAVGTRADIEALVEASHATGQPVDLAWAGDDLTGVDVLVRRAVHRVVRESLTNVHKHTPWASARISVRHDAVRIVVEVRNPLPATGTPAARGTGLGLVGLQERARLVGGTVTAGRQGGEFVVTAALPSSSLPSSSGPSSSLRSSSGPSSSRPSSGTGKITGGSDRDDSHIDHDVLIDGQTPGTGPGADAERTNEASSPRSQDTMSKLAKIILIGLVGTVLVACGGGLIGAYVLADKAKDAAISPAQYAAVEIGQTRAQVKVTIGDVGTIAKTAVDKSKEPPAPAGATCDYALSRENADNGPTHVYRFCFKADKLVEKKEMIFPNSSTN